MRRGLLLEPAVAQFYEEATGEQLVPVTPFRSGILAASPDRMTLGEKRFVEIKTHTPWVRAQYGEPYTEGVPVHIAAQVTAQVAVARRCGNLAAAQAEVHHVAAFFGDEFGVWLVRYDPAVGEEMLSRAEEWWERHMVHGEPPEVGGSQADADWIARTYPAPRIEEVRQADAETEALIVEFRQACLDASAASARKEALANRLKASIGDAAQLASSVGTFTFRLISGREIVDAKALREQYPDAYAECHRVGASYRRLDPPRGWLNE